MAKLQDVNLQGVKGKIWRSCLIVILCHLFPPYPREPEKVASASAAEARIGFRGVGMSLPVCYLFRFQSRVMPRSLLHSLTNLWRTFHVDVHR